MQRSSFHWWRSHAFSSITISFSLFLDEMWKICFGFLFPLYCCLFLIRYFSNQRLFPNLYKSTSEISLGAMRCGNFIGFCFFEQKIFKAVFPPVVFFLWLFSCYFSIQIIFWVKTQLKFHRKSLGITDNINLLRGFFWPLVLFFLLLCSWWFIYLFKGSHPSRAKYMKQNRKHKN